MLLPMAQLVFEAACSRHEVVDDEDALLHGKLKRGHAGNRERARVFGSDIRRRHDPVDRDNAAAIRRHSV